jgi:uncharacterized membrane protein
VTIESNRGLGLIGASLTTVGFISPLLSLANLSNNLFASLSITIVNGILGLVGLVGFVLWLVAMYGLSKDYNERGIFYNILWGILATIIAAVVFLVAAFILILSNLSGILSNSNPTTTIATATPNPSTALNPYLALILPFANFVMLAWVLFYMRAFNKLSDKSEVPIFKTAGKVFLASALIALAIDTVFAVLLFNSQLSITTFSAVISCSAILQYAAWGMIAVGFHRIKVLPQPQPQPVVYAPPIYVPPTQSTIGSVKYCTRCGAPNQIDSQYCTRCGQKLPTL